MALVLDPSSSYVAPTNLVEPTDSLPIFDVQQVPLHFPIAADFVAAQVANNSLVLALSTNRILRIDLDTPQDIDGKIPRDSDPAASIVSDGAKLFMYYRY